MMRAAVALLKHYCLSLCQRCIGYEMLGLSYSGIKTLGAGERKHEKARMKRK